MNGPLTASDAREELEALIRRSATLLDWSGKPRCVLGEGAITAILSAGDRYREAPADGAGRTVHLAPADGAGTACRRRWQQPELLLLTGNPAAVTCGKCRRSVRYRTMTGGGNG